MKKIILIDGNSLMFRAYYATAYTGNLMKTKDGLFTNALFGFSNMISKLIEKTEYMFISFDAGKETFRHKSFAEYKGTRKPMPEELRQQIPLIKEYLDVLKIKRLESLNYEGDDLIATVSEKFKNDFDIIEVITGDHDLLQLVSDKVIVSLTKKGVNDLDTYTVDNFFDKLGYMPNQVIEYKGIVGDTSDNLPGIKGVGEKTALKLLSEYHNLEGIMDNLDQLTLKTNNLFKEHVDMAKKCRELATLVRDADIDVNLDELKIPEYDSKQLINFYTKVEFSSMLKKIKQENVSDQEEIVKVKLSFDFENISGDGYIISEVFGSNYITGTFLGLGLYNNGKYYFFKESELNKVKDYLENSAYHKYTFDYKNIYYIMKKNGIVAKGFIFDLLLNSYLINPSYANDDFKITIEHFMDVKIDYYVNVYGANKKMMIPSSEVYMNYCLNKCFLLKEVKDIVLKEVLDIEVEFLSGVELQLSETLALMEYYGLKIDLDRLDKIGDDLNIKVDIVEKDIYRIAGEEFNINSPKQLGDILFTKLNLPHGKKNKTGYSTSVDVLEKLSGNYEIAKKILEYRRYTKLISTYINGLRDIHNNSFIHPLYKQALTNTGRLSSVEPNIQNMPIRTEVGQVIREIFVSRFPDGQIVSADYSQIELRVLAHLSKDDKMLEAFNNHIDIHSKIASQIYDVDVKDVTKEMRRTAKVINFGIIYGMSAWGLSESLGISPLEANIFINKYFYNFSEAKDCLDKFIKDAKDTGYSLTMFNRRRYIPELNDKNKAVVAFGERTAMNSPIQGTAADIIKIAMNKMQIELDKRKMKSIMIAQVHDELVFDCPKDEVEEIKKIVKSVMENAVKLDVLLEVGISSGSNWFEAK